MALIYCRYWFHLGQNLDTTRRLDQMATAAAEAASNTHVLTEEQLAHTHKDAITLEYLNKFTKKAKYALVVRGSSLSVLNGRYIECGQIGGSYCFKNVRGRIKILVLG